MSPGGLPLNGVVWKPPSRIIPRAIVLLAHPRTDFSIHYACPLLADRGFTVVGFATRYVNNDVDLMHELAADDVETVARWARTQLGGPLVFLGNSGGASLMAYSEARCVRRGESLCDGFIALAAHGGEGTYLMGAIDPSVISEGDILSVDSSLDMYDPSNGWKPWPQECAYDPGWLERYRAAQHKRIARIDQVAHSVLEEREQAVQAAKSMKAGSREWNRQRRRAVQGRYLTVYRTLADPAYLDPSIEPDDRPMGSIFAFGGDPLEANYGYFGLGRVSTARAWLSTWSALASKACLADSIPDVKVPTLIIHATGDTEVRMSQVASVVSATGAAEYVEIKGADHYLRGRRREAIEVMQDWIARKVL